MFLALAVLLNINKWIYFTLRIQAQINIREYQISEIVSTDIVADGKNKKLEEEED